MLEKVCTQLVRPVPFTQRTAGDDNHERKIIPVNTKEFRYLRFRAIGNLEWPTAGYNGNWDGFPYEHFEDTTPGYGYKSFVGKRAHVEHNSAEGLAGSIGDLPDAYLNKFKFPDSIAKEQRVWAKLGGQDNAKLRAEILSMAGQRDGSIEVLMRIDTKLVKSAKVKRSVRDLLDRIIRMIDTGQPLTCSMGANVEFSVCAACGNTSRFPTDYCNHLRHKKGSIVVVNANDLRDMMDKDLMRPEWLRHTIASEFDYDQVVNGYSNKGVAVKVGEINHKLSFFELSVVAIPAFPEAKQLEKLARKQGEMNKEYLERITRELGKDAVLDLYSFLQERGDISTQCSVR